MNEHTDEWAEKLQSHGLVEAAARRRQKAEQASEQADAIDRLTCCFPVGASVHVLLRHVSRSGMSRSISVLHAEGGEISDISFLLRRAGLGRFDSKHGGIVRQGCGMDMGADLVMSLSRLLHNDPYALRTVWL
jgi:hypothetical protein